MDKSRAEVLPGIWVDARRCVFVEEERILAVADLHLGYAWAHRFHGQLMPLQPDGVRERLLELCEFYKPSAIAVLGDIVHRAVPVSEIKDELLETVNSVQQHWGVKLVLGNHDKGLKRLLRSTPEQIEFHNSIETPRHLLLHGNSAPEPASDKLILMGHEHPAISLGDGVRSARFPCFLVSTGVIILPAFSRWAAGADIRSHQYMSPLARAAQFTRAWAILNGKLLPVPL